MGVRGKDVVVLGVEKKSVAKLQEERTVRKICLLDDHVVMAFAGLTADARILINRAQIECQSHKLTVEDPVTLEYITRYIAGLKQKYTQSNGRRPFGISCLIGGFDYDGHPHLFQTEPSGIYYEWKANATGRSAKTVREFLEKNYSAEEVASENGAVKVIIIILSCLCFIIMLLVFSCLFLFKLQFIILNRSIYDSNSFTRLYFNTYFTAYVMNISSVKNIFFSQLAIRALLEVVQSGQKNLEIAVMRRNQPMQMLDLDTINSYVSVIEKEKEEEAEKKKQKK